MNLKNTKIRVVFLGDRKSGKTSLITTLISDSFPEHVDSVMGPVLLPPEMYVQAHGATTILIDSSSDPQNDAQTNEEIKEANVLILLYDISSRVSVDNLKAYWMPRINKINSQAPVIVIATKLDLVKEEGDFFRIHDVIKPLMKDYKQVEIGLECSALIGKCIPDVIYCAQKVVLFPLSPLYDARQRVLKDDFKRALKRIFRLCDRDGDLRLSDDELRNFQYEVFEGELTSFDIKGIKQVIQEELEGESSDRGISFEGFVCLQKKCIDMMKIQTCWTILRHFGYNDKLEIREELFNDEIILDPKKSQSVELSGKAIFYIDQLFRQHAKYNLLDYSGILEIFDPINTLPWTNIERIVKTEIHNDEICLTQQSWICLWHLLTNQDYKRCFKFLVYIGFDGTMGDAFEATNTKSSLKELMKTIQREVLHVYVIGHEGSGKTSLLEYFISQKFNELHVPSPSTRSVITQIQFPNNRKKNVIFTEIPRIELQTVLSDEKKMIKCDLLLILFDDERKTARFLNEVGNLIPDSVPRLLVHTKNEKGNLIKSQQSLTQSVHLDESEHQAIPKISVKERNVNELLESLYLIIEKPTRSIPLTMISILKEQRHFWENTWGLFGLGFLSVAAIYVIIRYRRKIYKKLF